MAQVQLRLPQKILKTIDRWISEGKFKNRNDAIKTIVTFYEEQEKTRTFFNMLMKRSKEASERRMERIIDAQNSLRYGKKTAQTTKKRR